MHIRRNYPYAGAPPSMARNAAGPSSGAGSRPRLSNRPDVSLRQSVDQRILATPLESLEDAGELSQYLNSLQRGFNATAPSRVMRQKFEERWIQAAAYYATHSGRMDPRGVESNQKLLSYGQLCNNLSKPPRGNRVAWEAAENACAQLIGSGTLLRDADFFAPAKWARLAALKGFSLLVNGLSKYQGHGKCAADLQMMAQMIKPTWEASGIPLRDFDTIVLAMLVNGFSKLRHAADRNAVLTLLGDELLVRLHQGEFFNEQSLSNLVNGLSKIEDAATRERFLIALGERVTAMPAGAKFNEQNLSNLVNGLSKIEDGQVRERFLIALGERVTAMPAGAKFNEQNLSNLVNGLSKIEDAATRERFLIALGERVTAMPESAKFNEQGLSNLVNGLSRIEDAATRERFLIALGERVIAMPAGTKFSEQGLSNLVNGLSKIEDAATRERFLIALGERVTAVLAKAKFNEQDLSILINGLSKIEDAAARERLLLTLCRYLHAQIESGNLAWRDFDMRAFGMIVGSLSRLWGQRGEDAAPDAAREVLQGAARHLTQEPRRWENAHLRTVSMILRGLLYSDCYDERDQVAPLALARIEALRKEDELLRDASLEALGSLCFALLGVTERVTDQQQRAMTLLRDLRPALDAKARLYRQGGAAAGKAAGNDCSTRIPAITFYQVIKAHQVALRHLSRRNRPDGVTSREVRQAREEWQDWTRRFEAGLEDSFAWDLSSHTWSVIAELQAEVKTDIVEDFVLRHADAIGKREPEARFDWRANLRAMDHAPQAPQGRAGMLAIPRCTFSGKPLPAQDGDERYSALVRLTERDGEAQLPLLLVKLPEQMSIHMLNKIIAYEGRHYRIDTIGGSKLKGMSMTIEAVMAAAHGKRLARDGGWAYAVPLTDTRPGVPYDDLNAAFWPYEESFWYKQRAMLSAPPGMPGLGPHDHILEGRFPMLLMPDRQPGEHPFKLRDKDGKLLELQPHDGTGFIHEDLANKLGLFGKIRPGEPGRERLKRANLPSQATEHYPRNETVSREFQQRLREKLDDPDNPSADLRGETLFRAATGCLAKGHMGVAVPTQRSLVLPRSLGGDRSRNMLVARSPYDKPNLRPMSAAQVVTEGEDSPTARILAQMPVLQYSFVGEEHGPGQRETKPDAFFLKGLLGVVPRDMWPAECADRQIVLPAGDVKSNTSAVHDKARKKEDTRVDGVGVLAVGEVFEPGGAVGVPIGEQGLLDGDFDGDEVLLVDGEEYPAFFALVRECDAQWQALSGGSLKPPKSHTPARPDGESSEPGNYRHTRGPRMLATRKMVLEDFTGFMARFNHLPHEERQDFARQALFAAYEAPPLVLWEELTQLLDGDAEPDAAAVQGWLGKVEQQVPVAQHPASRQLLCMMHEDIRQWGRELDMAMPPPLPERQEAATDFARLRPDLAARRILMRPDTPTPAQDKAALWKHAPFRKLNVPVPPAAYADGQRLERAAADLLSAGIKAGTDAPKSKTGTYTFRLLGNDLQTIFTRSGVSVDIPYRKVTARRLAQQTFDVAGARASLARNPTLAAGNMEAALDLLVEEGVLQEESEPPAPLADEFADPGPADPLGQATARLMNAARRMEVQVTPALKAALSPTGGGLVHYKDRFKSAFALREKLQRIGEETGLYEHDAAAQVNDALRYYAVFPEHAFGTRVREAVEGLARQGFACTKWTNSFTPGAAYKAINAAFQTPEGGVFELQFHTRASFTVRLEGHKLYKQSQRAGEGSVEQQAIKAQLRQAADVVVPQPPALEALSAFEDRLPAAVLPSSNGPKPPARQRIARPPRGMTKDAALKERLEQGILPRTGQNIRKFIDANPTDTLGQAMAALMSEALQMEAQVTPVLAELLAPAGGGLSHYKDCFKSKQALAEKLKRLCEKDDVDEEQAAAQINDALRYYAVLPAQGFGQQVRSVVDGLATQGFQCVKWTNTFVPGARYKAINAAFQTAEGGVFELQFHTDASFKARRTGHRRYKESQRLEEGAPRRIQIEQALLDLASGVEAPQGLAALAAFEHSLPALPPQVASDPAQQAERREQRLMRRLTEQARHGLQKARNTDKRIGQLIDGLTARLPGVQEPRREGRFMDEAFLAQRLRTDEAVAQKTQGRGSTPRDRSRIVRDALCYRLMLPEPGFGKSAAALIAALEAGGQCTVTGMKDLFRDRTQPQFKAVVAWLKTADHQRFRVELHTEHSYAAGLEENRMALYRATQEPEVMSEHKRYKQLFAGKADEERARIRQEEHARDPEGFARMVKMEGRYQHLLEGLRGSVRDVPAPDTSALQERLEHFARRDAALEIIAREEAVEEDGEEEIDTGQIEALQRPVRAKQGRMPLLPQDTAFAQWDEAQVQSALAGPSRPAKTPPLIDANLFATQPAVKRSAAADELNELLKQQREADQSWGFGLSAEASARHGEAWLDDEISYPSDDEDMDDDEDMVADAEHRQEAWMDDGISELSDSDDRDNMELDAFD
jgi:hypothetical protein